MSKSARDVTLDELDSLYDAVVLATGASLDRRLGITGESPSRRDWFWSFCWLVQRAS